MHYYATLADAKAELKASGTIDDTKLLRNLRAVSARVDRVKQVARPFFLPVQETREIEIMRRVVNSYDNTLLLPWPLLAVTAVGVAGTTLTVGSSVEGWPTYESPFRQLRIIGSAPTWYDYCVTDNEPPMAAITGTWGWHGDYSHAWLAVDVLAGNITASATSLTVADVDGADPYGFSPRLSAGALLKIGTECIWAVATNTTTNAVTVVRGVLGTTAAAHTAADPVAVFQVEDDIRRVVARQAAFLYARAGAFESSAVTDMGIVNYPSDLLMELRATVGGYTYE